jgi:hypothetical protein
MNPPAKSPAPGCAVLLAGVVAAVLAFVRPAPAPGPGPVPPGPPPDPAGSFLVFVTDNEVRTPEQNAVLENDDLWKWLGDKKIGWRTIDKGGKVYAEQGYDQVLAADGVQPTCAVLWAPGNASHRTAPLPVNVEALKQWVIGSPHTGPPFIEVDGQKRYLTCLPPSQARFMAPRGGEFSAAHAAIPRAQWKEVDNRGKFPADKWVFDQDGIGSCVGNGATAALMKARALAGMSYLRLAPGCTYAQINGGQDRGAVISDSLVALQQTGTITSATLGSDEKPFYAKQMPAGWRGEAARFRIEEALKCNTFDDMATAIQLGYVVVYGMQVGQSFNSFTPEGVAGSSPGPGNHCMHADGLHKLPSGQWALDNVNSWGADWGPWKNGRCYLVEKHFQQGDQPDAYAVKTAVEDPLDPIKPPKKKVALADCPCGDGEPCGCNSDKKCKCPGCGCAVCPGKDFENREQRTEDRGQKNNGHLLSSVLCPLSSGISPPPGVIHPAKDCGCKTMADCKCGDDCNCPKCFFWKATDAEESALMNRTKQRGAYRFADGLFRPLDAGKWGPAGKPPIEAPSRQERFKTPSQAFPPAMRARACGPRG